jgi:hypothetical protein
MTKSLNSFSKRDNSVKVNKIVYFTLMIIIVERRLINNEI